MECLFKLSCSNSLPANVPGAFNQLESVPVNKFPGMFLIVSVANRLARGDNFCTSLSPKPYVPAKKALKEALTPDIAKSVAVYLSLSIQDFLI